MPVEETFNVNFCGKNCIRSSISTYLFKRVNKIFIIKNNFNYKSRTLIHVVIYQGCKEEYIGETGCLMKKMISVYRQYIKQPQYQQIKVEEYLCLYFSGEFQMIAFLQVKPERKPLRKVYEDYFRDRFKPHLNRRS